MGETTEPGDDVAVPNGELQRNVTIIRTLGREGTKQFNALFLVGEGLAVHEGHVEELPLVQTEVDVIGARDGAFGTGQAHIICGPCER